MVVVQRIVPMEDFISEPKTHEVQKLQQLVRKLEQENNLLQLERKNAVNTIDRFSEITFKCPNLTAGSKERCSLDDLPLNVLEDFKQPDCSWLYVPDNSDNRYNGADEVATSDWLRSDFDDLSNIVLQMSKKAILRMLDNRRVDRVLSPNYYCLSPSNSYDLGRQSNDSAIADQLNRTYELNQTRTVSPIKQSTPISRPPIDSRTLSRPRQHNPTFSVQSPVVGDRDVVVSINDCHLTLDEDLSSIASDTSSSHRLSDVEDIQTLARMQEQSLRSESISSVGSHNGIKVSFDKVSSGFNGSGDPLDFDWNSDASGNSSPYGSSQALDKSNSKMSASFCKSLPNLNVYAKRYGLASKIPSNSEVNGYDPKTKRASITTTTGAAPRGIPRRSGAGIAVPVARRPPGLALPLTRFPLGQTFRVNSPTRPVLVSRQPKTNVCPPAAAVPSNLPRFGLVKPALVQSGIPKAPVSRLQAPRIRSSIAKPVVARSNLSNNHLTSQEQDDWRDGCF